MDKRTWQALFRLMEQAKTYPAKEQMAFLRKACGDDIQQLQAVVAMLEAEETLDQFLERPAIFQLADQWDGEEDSDVLVPDDLAHLGNFSIRGRLGQGGMGDVWLAREDGVSRMVALKVVRNLLDTDEARQRFIQEYRALGRMEHACIARIFTAGQTAIGRPFFTMEYFPGQPLTEYAASLQLDLTQRLNLFEQVCSGVAHAHRKGIIHRDLKPSNILVADTDTGPQVKIIDFGIALPFLEQTADVTATSAHVVGTPAYMSPEQMAAVDVDTRSDIYGLGAVLYELITGRPPFDPKRLRESSAADQRRIIHGETPPPPSHVLANVASGRKGPSPRPDLDAVVMKALAKQPKTRYATVEELVSDVRAFLAHKPISAYPGGYFYRLGQLYRRHRLGVVALCVAILAILGGSIAATVGYIIAERARATANAKAEELAEVLTIVTEQIDAVDPYNLHLDTKRFDFDPRHYANLSLSPASRHRLLFSLGQANIGRGQWEMAASCFEMGRHLAQPTWGEHDQRTQAMRERLALVFLEQGKLDEAEVLYCPLYDDEGTTEVAMKVRHGMAELARRRGDLPQSAYGYRHLLADRVILDGVDDLETLLVMSGAGIVAMEQSELEEAYLLLAFAHERQSETLGPGHPLTLHTFNAEINVLENLNELSPFQSLSRRRYGFALLTESLQVNHHLAMVYLINIIMDLGTVGDNETALAYGELLRQNRQSVLGNNQRLGWLAWDKYAQALRNSGRIRDARQAHTELLEMVREENPDHEIVFRLRNNFSNTLIAAKQFVAAEEEMRQTVAAARKRFGATSTKVAIYQATLAEALVAQQKYDEAIALLEHSTAHGGSYRATFQALLGLCLAEAGRFEDALPHLRESLSQVQGDLATRVQTALEQSKKNK